MTASVAAQKNLTDRNLPCEPVILILLVVPNARGRIGFEPSEGKVACRRAPDSAILGLTHSRLLSTCCVLLSVAVAAAQQSDQADLIQAHLEAGEFGLAQDIANQAGPQRDHWLGQIAEAQVRRGARSASRYTLSQIQDSRQLGYAVDSISAAGPDARGGGSQADFDTLINLITTTVAPESWEDLGGPGAIDGFPSGVYVDAAGVLQRIELGTADEEKQLSRKRAAARKVSGASDDVRTESGLRMVSLNRLEREIQLRRAMGQEPTEAMQHLAGLREVRYVFLYPETHDIVLAGPAGNWYRDVEGRAVSVTGRPVLQLDDFVVLLRNAFSDDGRFGCSISPKQDNLASTKAYITESTQRPLRSSGERRRWLEKLEATLGNQNVDVYGVDRRTRVGRVIVEADYHMKLVGMGIQPGVLGVSSYLNLIELGPGESPPPMDLLRWWFTLDYDAVMTNNTNDAFTLKGQGVKVLSENELLTEQGQRVHTGQSDELNRAFAASFTEHFAALAEKYPIYAELKNVFDLALVAALIQQRDLHTQVEWPAAHFLDAEGYQVQLGSAPLEVPTVVSHRVINRKHVVAGISGGVTVQTGKLVQSASIQLDSYGRLDADYRQSVPQGASEDRNRWWWD